jgi:hypothetical protein
MGHDYAITLAGTLVDTVVRRSRFLQLTAGSKRDSNLLLPYKHGVLHTPDKLWDSADVLLEVFLPADAVEESSEAMSLFTFEFAAQDLVELKYTDPWTTKGIIRARVELLTQPVPSQDRLSYLFVLSNPAAFWESDTLSTAASANPPSVTTIGDRPIDDMILTAAGPGFLEHTDALGQTSRVTIDAAAGAGTYVVDVGAGTVKKAAVDQDEFLTVDQPWWMKFAPGVAQSFTSDVAWSVDWRTKWA